MLNYFFFLGAFHIIRCVMETQTALMVQMNCLMAANENLAQAGNFNVTMAYASLHIISKAQLIDF